MQRAAYAAGQMPPELPSLSHVPSAEPLRLGIAEAAAWLGVSPDTIRRRIKRGQLQATRDNTGRLWIELPADHAKARLPLPRQPAAYAPMQEDQTALLEELRSHIASLRNELDRADAERNRLLNMLEEAQAALTARNQGVLVQLWDRLIGLRR